jgi:hypothetical protein
MWRAVTNLPDGGRINGHERQGLPSNVVRDRLADEDVVESGHANDVAGVGFGNFDALESFKMENRGNLARRFAAVAVQAGRLVADFGFAAVYFAEGDTPDVIGIIQVGHQHLEFHPGMGAGRGDVFNDGVKKRLHGRALLFEVDLGVTILGAGIDGGEIQLLIGGVERDEEIKDAIQDFVWIDVVAVNFIDDDDGLGAGFQGLAQDEAGLGLGAIGGIDHQEDAVDHVHDALDFAAEIGVAGGIDDVDVVILVFEGGVFGADGDAFFAFEVHRIHDALLGGDGLIGAKGTRLFEQAIHQSGLAMINMGDNCYVAYVIHE